MKQLIDYEDYRSADARLAELRTELAGAEAEQLRLNTEINQHAASRRDSIEAAAERLLAGEDAAHGTDNGELVKQHAEAARQAEILRRAVSMQTAEADGLRARYSAEINKGAAKEYNRLMGAAVEAAAKQSQAFAAAMAYRDTLEQSGVIVTLPRLDIVGKFGRYEQPSAHIHAVISEAEKAGIIKPGVYPKPKAPGMYDHLPAEGVEAVSAGPAGISRVQIHRGGKLQTLETLHSTTDEENSRDGWGGKRVHNL